MFEENVAEVLRQIGLSERVLDIGGWALPFNRATHILDIQPYETRGMLGFQGSVEEHFHKDSWIMRDLCDRALYPFPDKYFDYVICSHTLEDIRDPVFVCSEIKRIGRRGYIEVPSITSELMLGLENDRYAGRSHHRWLVDIQTSTIEFIFKYHHIHSYWKYHLPRQNQKLAARERVQFLFWEGDFRFGERILITTKEIDSYLSSKVKACGGYPPFPLWLNTAKDETKHKIRKILRRLTWRRGLV